VKDAGAAAEKVKAAPSLETLEALRREVAELDEHDRRSPPLGLRYGLYRGSTVNPAVRKVYFDALRRLLLIPAAGRIGRELDELDKKEGKNAQDFDALNDLHRVYQMLGGAPGADKNRDLVEQVLTGANRWYAGAGGEPQPAAEAQLRFFTTQLDRPEEWKVTIDGALERRVKEHLAQGLWVLQSYRDVVDTTKGGFSPVTGERFVRGPGKALLQFNHSFSGLFTQQGWNDVAKSAVKSKAEALSRRFKEIGVERKQEDVEAELRGKYVEQYAREWEAFAKGVKIQPFQYLEDASTRLKILAGDESPLTELFRGMWDEQVLRLSDADLKPPLDLKPVDEARNALYEFHLAIDEFAGAAQRGSRIAPAIKDGKLAKLLESFKTASRALDAAIRKSEPRMQQPGFRAIVMQAVDATRQALASEAQAEADSTWAREVAKPWKEQLAGRYPFEPGAAEGVPIGAVTRLFNRPTGAFWATVADLNAMHAINFEGKPLIVFSREYLSAVKRAEALRDAFYPAASDKLSVPFAVTLRQRTGVTHVRLKVGSKEFTHNESPDGRGVFAWKEAEPGVKFSVRVGDLNRWSEKEFADDWGLLRLVGVGGGQAQGPNKIACSYTFKETVQGVELEFTGEAVFEAEGAQNPFQKGLFGGWIVPEKVGP
jgi:type VI protein secretion system component VasK